jgi:hypothetical protein
VASLYLEIDCVPTEEGAEHPFSYFKTELKEFLENFGWKAVKITGSEEDEDED